MADLVANTQYGLSSSAHSCPDKTALLLKLTDSSLKAIERYQKAKGNIRKTPIIHFKGSKGIITIPVRESGDEGFRDFKFTVQPLSVPSGSSYECIQQFTNSKGIPHLDSISCIKTKVHVSATDDVYQTTQEKMKLADEELKKTSTKEVSQKEIKATRKIKKITKRPSQTSLIKPSITPKSQPTNTASAISWNNGTKAPTSRVSNVPSKGAVTTKPAVPNRSYRDRVIHLLALRPYKKPELILRLQRDGIIMKDKNQLSTILSQVALSKDNAYTLKKHLYNEVQEDWPLYSDADRLLVTKNLKHLNPKEHSSSVNTMSVSLSSSSTSSLSSKSSSKSTSSSKPPSSKTPSTKTPSSKPPSTKPPSSKTPSSKTPSSKQPSSKPSLSRMPSKDFPKPNPVPNVNTMRTVQIAAEKLKAKIAHKRPLLPDVVDFKAPKKTRIAHNAKKASPTADGSSASCSPPSKYDVSSTTKQSPDHLVMSSPPSKPVEKETKKRPEPETRLKVTEAVGKLSPPSDVSSTSSGPDYLNKFSTITSHEQKQRYKDVFNRDYPEYKKMHSYVEGVTLKFTKLKEQLHNASEDSDEYQQIKINVLEEYTKIQADKDYLKKEARWRELHEKLAHVKSLIAAYDNSRQHGTTT